MKKLTGEETICKATPTSNTYVYIGSFSNLVPANDILNWRRLPEYDLPSLGIIAEELTLDEISIQLKERLKTHDSPLITIFEQEPLHGKIYQWGNYGNGWYEIGETCGYA